MIITVTLNPAIDKTLSLQELRQGEVNRLLSSHSDEGGKGINVSKVLRELGISSTATGFLGGESGDYIRKKLAEREIDCAFISVKGQTRTNIKVTEPDGTTTDLNEPGPRLDGEDCRCFHQRLRELISPGDLVLLAGSLPSGVSSDFYAELIADCREKGVKTFVDASGDALRYAVEAKPYFIKPNREEFLQLTGKRSETVSEICTACESLLKQGLSHIAVTLGGDGAVLASEQGFFYAKAVPVKVACTVGSGDAFLAGILYGMEQRKTLPDILRLAVGAGSANASQTGTEPPDAQAIFRLASQVQIKKL